MRQYLGLLVLYAALAPRLGNSLMTADPHLLGELALSYVHALSTG